MDHADLTLRLLTLVALGNPVLLLVILGTTTFVGNPLREQVVGRLVQWATLVGLLVSLAVLALMLLTGKRDVVIDFGDWVRLEDLHFHFHFSLAFDRLSAPFVILSFVLCGTIGAFANRYMHREAGYHRFFVLYALFLTGILVTSLANTIETLFSGWELVGLSSTLLVAFYHERPNPVRNGLYVWCIYRVSDAALLLAAVALHHLTGEGNFSQVLGSVPWPYGQTSLSAHHALVVGGLLLVAAAGKSALVPFCGWLPRAMEGPTPSSAVYYGALSVHLGAFLLLRFSPLLDVSLALRIATVTIGLATALVASLSVRVQTDIKSALSFASLAQVGIIVVEIGLGLRYIALAHLLGHACLRTLQFVRAPTLLYDYHSLENALGTQLSQASATPDRRRRKFGANRLYRMALERGYLDVLLTDWLAAPLLGIFKRVNRLEQRWTEWLSGQPLGSEAQARPPKRPHAAQHVEDEARG